jgi:hypothetical protein
MYGSTGRIKLFDSFFEPPLWSAHAPCNSSAFRASELECRRRLEKEGLIVRNIEGWERRGRLAEQAEEEEEEEERHSLEPS